MIIFANQNTPCHFDQSNVGVQLSFVTKLGIFSLKKIQEDNSCIILSSGHQQSCKCKALATYNRFIMNHESVIINLSNVIKGMIRYDMG